MNDELDQKINNLTTVVSDVFKRSDKRIDDLAEDMAERFTRQDEQTKFHFFIEVHLVPSSPSRTLTSYMEK